jgi:hypothetical protein
MTTVGPVKPLPHGVAGMVDSSWLLDGRMSGVSGITFRGRRAYHLTMLPGDGELPSGPLMFRPADVVVDAESGCLLRAISYAGDRIASWWEITDIVLEPPGPGEFRPQIPPGTRIVEETGNLFTDATAIMPGMTGAAVRTTAGTVRKAAGAVSAARRFLDDLRGGPPPRSG